MNALVQGPLPMLASNFFEDHLILTGLLVFLGFVILAPLLNKLLRRLFPPKEDRTVETFAVSCGLALVANANPDMECLVFEGKVDGLSVKLSAGPDAPVQDERKRPVISDDFVSVAVQCTRPWPRGLQLWSETGLEKMRKRVRDLNEVEIGDEEMDNKLIIRGALAVEIKALLAAPQVREEMLRLFSEWPESMLSDHWIRCEQSEFKATKTMLEKMLQTALALAKVLDQAAR